MYNFVTRTNRGGEKKRERKEKKKKKKRKEEKKRREEGGKKKKKGEKKRKRRFSPGRRSRGYARATRTSRVERCLIYAFRISFVPRMNSTANKNHRSGIYASTISLRSPNPLFLGIVIAAIRAGTRNEGGGGRAESRGGGEREREEGKIAYGEKSGKNIGVQEKEWNLSPPPLFLSFSLCACR